MEKLADELAKLLSDYRKPENLNPKVGNILKWVSQFSAENQSIILEEMIHVCKQRYLTEDEINEFLTGLVTNNKLTQNNPSFWKNVSLLQIQQNGHSQRIMNEKFKQIVKKSTGIDITINDVTKEHFIHLDDFLFTGNRLKTDLSKWLETALQNAKLDIVYIGYYKNGQFNINKNLEANNPNNVKITFWRLMEMENNPNCQNVSETLLPTTSILELDGISDYIEIQPGYKLRDLKQKTGGYCGKSIFSSEKNRQILEKEFTIAGLKINSSIHDSSKKKYWKPLGISSYNGLGFGAMVFSYRNCPNNTPLALWWGDWDSNVIWYPLLQRKTYALTAEEIFGKI